MNTRYFKRMLNIGFQVLAGLMVINLALAHRNPPPDTDAAVAAFEQLDERGLRSPNSIRAASGAPGPNYWQQQVDYVIDVTLDEKRRRIIGSGDIKYTNNSPDTLRFLWVQLDQNRFETDSEEMRSFTVPSLDEMTYETFEMILERHEFQGGVRISSLTDANGKPLEHTVVGTMMRVDLPTPLAPGGSASFSIEWEHNIVNGTNMPARGGYEYFEEDGNDIFEISQWYPRLVAYTDYSGWQHKAFLGGGEFTLEFGQFEVNITVPADHVVASTGVLQNPDAVLSREQRKRLQQAQGAEKPVYIVTPDEAVINSKSRPNGTRTWRFKASDVRDFAFASSRRFIWDALGHKTPGGKPVQSMSFYPKEAQPLWNQFSTESVIHAINIYSKQVFDYPYPVAISVNGPQGGMEYPMITFNGPRPFKDGTYFRRPDGMDDPKREHTKNALVSVIVHEIGHTWFPMVVNSDEREWTWLDEGLNTFVQFLAEEAWQENYGGSSGYPERITSYMLSEPQTALMTQSDSLKQFFNNAYRKPATALNILRETVLGRKQFDYAFKEYARRWKFKRPTPADFFRSMEDASGVDLDWFWHGWFYGTQHVDISIDRVTQYRLDTLNPDVEKAHARQEHESRPRNQTELRNQGRTRRVEEKPGLKDFYDNYDEFAVTPSDEKEYVEFLEELTEHEKLLLKTNKLFYMVEFENVGGVVMPLPVRITYADNTKTDIYLAPEIWRYDTRRASRLFISDQPILSWELDPQLEIADTDRGNNHYPRQPEERSFRLKKPELDIPLNPMQKAREGAELEARE